MQIGMNTEREERRKRRTQTRKEDSREERTQKEKNAKRESIRSRVEY